MVGLVAVAALGVAGLVLPATVATGFSEAMGLSPASEVASATAGAGSHAFLQHQHGRSGAPVTYDPCQVVRIRIDTDGLDAASEPLAREVIGSALEEVSAATGLRLANDVSPGHSRRQPAAQALSGQGPALISFATSSEVPELRGRVTGVGGSTSVRRSGLRTYVSGQVTLDAKAFNRWLSEPAFVDSAKAIVLHELGHLVGLAHVRDPDELMNELNIGQLDFGPGDRRGLAELGRGPCF